MSNPAPRQTLQQRVSTAILDGAARLFAVQGEQANMNDVAAAAGVARATVYRYFPNRQALLDELAQVALNDAEARLESARIDEVAPLEGIVRTVRALVDVGDAFVLLARERVRSEPGRFERSISQPLRLMFERGQATADLRGDIASRTSDRVADRIDRRPDHVDAAARQGGHHRHDHRPLPRWRPGPRPTASMNEDQPATAMRRPNPVPEEEEMDHEPDRSAPEAEADEPRNSRSAEPQDDDASSLLQELVAYLRDNRTELREEWARRISEAELLGVMSDEEIFSEATAVYDNYVDALETGSIETLQTYARELSERIIPRGVETHEVLGIVLLLRDVLARSLFAKYQEDRELLNRILDAYEPAANRIAVTVGVSFVEERERVIHDQQESLRELSTPVLQLRERLLILPIIGVLDSARARQLTEQLLGAIQENRARVVVIDITGVATIDRTVANHLVQTVEASRLMGASTILTGLSSEIAQTLVDLGVDLGTMRTVGDLQGGLEEAERLAGYRDAEDDAFGDRRELGRTPMSVAILRQGDYLIASIQSDLSDRQVLELREELAEMVGRCRARGIVIDVAALDVIDSFVARALRSIVLTARLRGAEAVIVGIRPDVAIAMVQFRLNLGQLRVALDLDEALTLLDRLTRRDGEDGR